MPMTAGRNLTAQKRLRHSATCTGRERTSRSAKGINRNRNTSLNRYGFDCQNLLKCYQVLFKSSNRREMNK